MNKSKTRKSSSKIASKFSTPSKKTDSCVEDFLKKHKLARKSNQADLSKSPDLNYFENAELQELRKQNAELTNYAKKIELESQNLEKRCKEMCGVLESANKRICSLYTSHPDTQSEILRYAEFILEKLEESPQMQRKVLQQVKSASGFLLELKSPEKTGTCLRKILRVLADIIEMKSLPTPRHCEEGGYAERIQNLNTQITDSINSTRKLLGTHEGLYDNTN